MGFLDRLLGREPRPQQRYQQHDGPRAPQQPADPDQAAIERYRYLLRTAPPEALEQAHAEAFAQLTPEQRRQVLEGLSAEVPPSERAADDDPRSLARMATRAELRQPGTLERSFGRGGPGVGGGTGMGMGMGMGGMIAGSLLASVAGAFVGTAIADSLFDLGDSGDAGADAAAGSEDAGADQGDTGGDVGGGDVSADGGGWGDFGGGDFGGGFGGGDFGGGDF